VPRAIAAVKRIPAADNTLPFSISPNLAMAVIAGDNRGADAIFIAYDSVIQNRRRVALAYSLDAGQNWQQTLLPDSPNADRFLPWVTAEPATKALYVVWLEKERGENRAMTLKMAVSKNNGRTFSQPRELDQIPELLALCQERRFIGDYIAAAAMKTGLFVAWPDTVTIDDRTSVVIKTLFNLDNP